MFLRRTCFAIFLGLYSLSPNLVLLGSCETVKFTKIPTIPAALNSTLVFEVAVEETVEQHDTELAPEKNYTYEWTVHGIGLVQNHTSTSRKDKLEAEFITPKYKSRTYQMNVTVKGSVGNTSEIISSINTNFTLTEHLNGKLTVSQASKFHNQPKKFATNHPLLYEVLITDTFNSSYKIHYEFLANTTKSLHKSLNNITDGSEQKANYSRAAGFSSIGTCNFSVKVIVQTEKNETIQQNKFEDKGSLYDEVQLIVYLGTDIFYNTDKISGIIACDGSGPLNYTVELEKNEVVPMLERSSLGKLDATPSQNGSNLSWCKFDFDFGDKVNLGVYQLVVRINNSVSLKEEAFSLTVQRPIYYVPPLEPFVIVSAILVSIMMVLSLLYAYWRDRQPQRPAFTIERAERSLYQPYSTNPSYLEWLTGEPDSFVNRLRAWLERKRQHGLSRHNSNYRPLIDRDDVVT